MKKDPTLKFTNIQHDFRREHDLSCDEYTLCDMVFFLSRGEASQVPGWCYKSKENLANEIGISKQGVLNMIERMVLKGFIIRNDQTKYLKTTEKWQQVYFTDAESQQSLPPVQKQTASEKTIPETVNKVDHEESTNLTAGSQQTLPHNNSNSNSNTDSNTNNDDVVGGNLRPAVFKKPFKKLTQAEFRLQVHYYTPIYGEEMCKEFYDRWRQKNTNGVMRFQLQDFWDTGTRLAGWKKFEDEEIKKRTNGNPINRPTTGQSSYAAIVGTTKQGTSQARTTAVEDRLRRNEILRSQAQNTTGENGDQSGGA